MRYFQLIEWLYTDTFLETMRFDKMPIASRKRYLLNVKENQATVSVLPENEIGEQPCE